MTNKNYKNKTQSSHIIHINELINVKSNTHKCVNTSNNYLTSVNESIAKQIQNDKVNPDGVNLIKKHDKSNESRILKINLNSKIN